jgi:cell wall-associated NlpC family hydrolase
LTFLAVAATPALAGTTGGAVAQSTTAPATTAPATTPPATTAPAIHLSPITSKSRRLTYKGPIYQKTATGEVVPYAPPAPGAQLTGTTGGSTATASSTTSAAHSAATEPTPGAATPQPQLLVPGALARYVNGYAAAPISAPESVQKVIWQANEIIGLPYIYGGGHASFVSPGYDCSGTVSYALHGGSFLTTPMDSSEFMKWGSHGAGRWIAVFGNSGHAYMDVAGLRLDTSAAGDPTNQQGPRWRPLRTDNGGYTVRHPLGL